MSFKFKQSIFLLISQIIILILFGTCVNFSANVYPSNEPSTAPLSKFYPMFQDVHVMIFVGFGFLMVFLREHSWSSVGFNLLVATWSIQLTILFRGLWHYAMGEVKEGKSHEKIALNIEGMIAADFGAATVLISFGVLLGKLNALQLCVMAIFEIFVYTLNETIAVEYFGVLDIGGSMIIHMFGGVFGMAVSQVFSPRNASENKRCSHHYQSNLMAMIGTLFLWMYWPSFNSIFAGANAQHRAVVNTYLSLSSCTMSTFFLSGVFNDGKFSMEDVLNATLAGGVAVGSTADLIVDPVYSLLIGFIAGIISVIGYNKLGPWINDKLKLHDTCGVNNLHLMPGFTGGLISVIVCAASDKQVFGIDLKDIQEDIYNGKRTFSGQAQMQLATLVVSFAIALFSGYATGAILKLSIWEGPGDKEELLFTDLNWWNGVHEADDEENQDHNIGNSDKQDPNMMKTYQKRYTACDVKQNKYHGKEMKIIPPRDQNNENLYSINTEQSQNNNLISPNFTEGQKIIQEKQDN